MPLSSTQEKPPEPVDNGAVAPDLGRIAVAMWRHRTPLIVAALVCGLASGAATWLRTGRWVGTVHLAVGYIPPVQRIEDPAELAQRLRSGTQVLEMSGMTHCILPSDDATLPPDCPYRLVLESEAIASTSLVTFTVETNSSDKSRELVNRVTEAIISEHDRLFDEVRASNQRNIEESEQLLARLEADLAGRHTQRRPAPPSPAADPETVSVWSQVVAVRQHLETLRSYNLAAQARPTRAVAGPEVERKRRVPSPPIAAFLGAFAGLAFTALSLAMRRAIAERR